ncbi:response regulator transcription factor [Microtetraspora malaysiensis]|uniref:response regulator transcription factor n=1 Tax=Microtetraspora malaysiensis TaxID=161358 RepID=UPI003D8E0F9A
MHGVGGVRSRADSGPEAEFLRTPHPAPAARDLTDITQRESEVLYLIGNGMSDSEIAEHLHLTIGTVKTHIGRLLAKLHTRDRGQLVIAAYEGGLIAIPDSRQ